ncbi:hypothetical protein KC131_05220 [Pseudomonas sp. JQ170]|uniref:hypothetical protein n=1 Tax=unclassified Pseudomonas TaxID=196821 RepID=UPI00264D0632|nr:MULTISPECIES: hypothetical protein [unclassified Pseudomonas]MDN7140037.1 hypothetical protein [Pseudomonas sp. JQ170]WRO78604.1 hypothetical protein U9R80_13310 [Pseudomonas sp. 170C]
MKFFIGLTSKVLACLAILVSQQVGAADRTLTFVYSPNPANPGSNQFINTTPNSGYCSDRPSSCSSGEKSITAGITSIRTLIPTPPPSLEQGGSFKLPGGWHDIEVSNGSEHAPLRFRITGIKATHQFGQNVLDLTGMGSLEQAHNALWQGGHWANAASPCSFGGTAYITVTFQNFYWNIPASGTSRCGKINNFNLVNFWINNFGFKYVVEMPDPQSLPSGRYTGTKTFSFGPGGDFDFGGVAMAPQVLNLNFDVTVNHVLEASFPPGSSTAALQPQGGWLQWLQRGRRPEKLSIDQHFRFSTNNAFKMHIECQYTVGNQCGIQNGSGHQVPVESRVTLPAGINNASGQPANRQLLSPVDKHVFTPTRLVNDSRAQLHFEVGRDDVKDMIDHHSGSKYSGNVTVVWDSDIAAP